MNKKIAILLLFTSMGINIQAQKQISFIKNDGSCYHVYDVDGRRITTVAKQTVGEILGWGIDFFVSREGNWYKIYDSTGKKINTLSKMSVGEVIAVSGTTFTSKDGGWYKIYDKTGKKIDTRSAQ